MLLMLRHYLDGRCSTCGGKGSQLPAQLQSCGPRCAKGVGWTSTGEICHEPWWAMPWEASSIHPPTHLEQGTCTRMTTCSQKR
ncbi:BQ5605_C016g08282 [Microbotryum silenes-dioicae]|nr:BQ5605_C016g08282 [Microbotryum silenes-dioicae]